MEKLLKKLPYDFDSPKTGNNLENLIEILKISKPENYIAFDKFIQELNSLNLLNENFLEDNSSNLLEMSLVLNQLKKNQKFEKINNDSTAFKQKENSYCANYQDNNIFKEILLDNDRFSMTNKSRVESDGNSDFNYIKQIKHIQTFIPSKNSFSLIRESDIRYSCKSEIHITKDRFSKLKVLYQKKVVNEFFHHQLSKENQGLFWIRTQFFKIFLKDYGNKQKIFSKFKEKNNEDINKELNDLINDLKSFLKIYNETLIIYYDLKRIDFQSFIKEEGLLEILISLVFNENPKLFKFFNFYQKKIESIAELQIEFNKKKCSKWKPEDFGVSEKFSLNKRNLDYLSQKMQKKSILSFGKINEDSFNKTDKEIVFLSLMENCPEQTSNYQFDVNEREYQEESENEKEISKVFKNNYANIIKYTLSLSKKISPLSNKNKNGFLIQMPFEKAIKKLEEINKIKNPIQILLKIMEVSIEIIRCIMIFYEGAGEIFDGNIESDELMSIFLYICTKSDTPLLYSKLCLIQNFLTFKKAKSIYGYYLTILIASLSCLTDESFYSRNKQKHNQKYFLQSLMKFSNIYNSFEMN